MKAAYVITAIAAAAAIYGWVSLSNDRIDRLNAIDDCVRAKSADNMKEYGEAAWKMFAEDCAN